MRRIGKLLPVLVLFFGTISNIFAVEGTLLFQNDYRGRGTAGLWRIDYPSNTVKQLTSEMLRRSNFSPDGTKLVYLANSNRTLYIMNNDGTGKKELAKDINWGRDCKIWWTEQGIMWLDENFVLVSCNPDNGQITNKFDMKTLGTTCGGSGINISTSGLRMWTSAGFDPKDVDSLYCGVRGYDRGGHAYLNFKPDFSGYDIAWHSDWGHGNTMTANGYLLLIELGGGHDQQFVTYLNGNTIEYVPTGSTTGKINQIDPPFPDDYECRSQCPAKNNDSVIATFAYKSGAVRLIMWNWRTRKELCDFKRPNSDSYGAIAECAGSLWYGKLPTQNSPYLTADKSEVIFDIATNPSTTSQTVTITNTGTNTLSKVSATKKTSADWLTVTIEGSGGNTQTITNTINTSGLTAADYSATVEISGGGASNTVTYTVNVYTSAGLPAPSQCAVTDTGDSLLDAAITWTDNSSDETGFIIERKTGTGSFEEIKRVGANETSYSDKQLTLGTKYTYRLAAYKNTTVSGWSNEAELIINGVLWIRVTSPSANDVYKPGDTCHVKWEENRVDNVYVAVSTDDGLTWETVTAEGGIVVGNKSWGDYSWIVPDIESNNVLVKVSEYSNTLFALSSPFIVTKNPENSLLLQQMEFTDDGFNIVLAENILRISAPTEYGITMALYDMYGRQVIRKNVPAGTSYNMARKSLPSSCYAMRITDSRNMRSITRRLVW